MKQLTLKQCVMLLKLCIVLLLLSVASFFLFSISISKSRANDVKKEPGVSRNEKISGHHWINVTKGESNNFSSGIYTPLPASLLSNQFIQ